MELQGTTDHRTVTSYLLGLWTEILHKDVGTTDDFFEVGGDSLSAIRMIVEVQKTYKVEIEMETFFEVPSVERLANLIVARHS